MATLIERGLGFLSSLLAARLGGAQIFGAYSVGLTTATNVASYAGAGIGTTANRFSGEFKYGEAGYGRLVWSLSAFSLSASALGAGILWVMAGPIAARLLRNPGLTPLLQLSALSVGAIILLECLRGLLIGQRRFAALLTLSVLSGGGLAVIVPTLARRGAYAMTLGQVSAVLGAVAVCIALAGKLRFAPRGQLEEAGPRLSQIVKFGGLQLASMIGVNAAGWWIASLVARSDVSLVQMACYSVGMQARNIFAMPPQLIATSAYAQMTDYGGQRYGGAGRVTLVSTIATIVVALCITGPAAGLVPYMLSHLYGRSYAGAELAATLLLATGLIHMSTGPAAARLTIVSLPLAGAVNAVWTIFAIGLGTWLVPRGGAASAAAVFLCSHLLSGCLTLAALWRLKAVPRELAIMSLPSFAGSMLLAGLGWLRWTTGHRLLLSALMPVVCGLLVVITIRLARREGLVFPTSLVRLLRFDSLLAFRRAAQEQKLKEQAT